MIVKCEQCKEYVYGEHHCELFEFEVKHWKTEKVFANDLEDALKKLGRRYFEQYRLRQIVASYQNKQYEINTEVSIIVHVEELKEE